MKQGCQDDSMLVMYLKGIEWHRIRRVDKIHN
jgi:hypothetical protein